MEQGRIGTVGPPSQSNSFFTTESYSSGASLVPRDWLKVVSTPETGYEATAYPFAIAAAWY